MCRRDTFQKKSTTTTWLWVDWYLSNASIWPSRRVIGSSGGCGSSGQERNTSVSRKWQALTWSFLADSMSTRFARATRTAALYFFLRRKTLESCRWKRSRSEERRVGKEG